MFSGELVLVSGKSANLTEILGDSCLILSKSLLNPAGLADVSGLEDSYKSGIITTVGVFGDNWKGFVNDSDGTFLLETPGDISESTHLDAEGFPCKKCTFVIRFNNLCH